MGDFRKLEVWQLAMDLAVFIYKITDSGKFSRDYDLRSQIRKASVSIPSNISEGDESGSNKQSIRYFNIAKGSSAEVQTQAIIAFEIGYISPEENSEIISRCEIISKKLVNLIKFRSKNLKPTT
ncbi:MAG: four helix bundle protein [Candidatus Celaenobacter polaris]|nr:four helix bundle protein [Candidatus Celaenobacter polaris]